MFYSLTPDAEEQGVIRNPDFCSSSRCVQQISEPDILTKVCLVVSNPAQGNHSIMPQIKPLSIVRNADHHIHQSSQ
jgi:hypothetical protein